MCSKIVSRLYYSFRVSRVGWCREKWLEEAEFSEFLCPSMTFTSRAIVGEVVRSSFEVEVVQEDWLVYAQDCIGRGYFEVARCVYQVLLSGCIGREEIWRSAAVLEQLVGKRTDVDAVLRESLRYCPGSVMLWKFWARYKIGLGEEHQARHLLYEATVTCGGVDELWLLAYQLEN